VNRRRRLRDDEPGVKASVQAAINALAAGRLVLVTDDPNRENEGDVVGAASMITTAEMAFMVRHTSGIVCTPMPAARADALRLVPMVSGATGGSADPLGTAFTVSVDHIGTGTGVSAADRARTVRALADPAATPTEFRRPGHVFPLKARDGGVLERAGHTEATVDLLQMAGLAPVGVIGEVVSADGDMARNAELAAFAVEHDLVKLSIADLISYRISTEQLVEASGRAQLPTLHGHFEVVAYRSRIDGADHLALVMGDIARAAQQPDGVLTRVHSECLTGDVLGSLRCDCGTQLEAAMSAIAAEGAGVLVYLRGHEGRGIGLGDKLRAYALQEKGHDTVSANVALGLPVDAREYGVAVQILADLGVRRVRLMTHNLDKQARLIQYGLEVVARTDLPIQVDPHNLSYLQTKRDRMGHLLDLTAL
jgi:3,4-dihydroxy 2-butanone 4-phosphate synthase/GTP cyclohydrolase II